jgi:excisionase family DNA binding protein
VVMDPYDEVLTTQEAADLLHVSRPHLIDDLLTDSGRDSGIPFYWAGRHRRIRLSDVEAYLAQRAENLTSVVGVSQAENVEQLRDDVLTTMMPALTGVDELETVLSTAADQPDAVERVRAALGHSHIYTLGRPAGEHVGPGMHTETDLLHFTIEDASGHERVMLPVFTRINIMREALQRNPEWAGLAVLEVDGQQLLKNVDSDVIIVVNPWSGFEFQLPATESEMSAESAGSIPDAESAHTDTYRAVEATADPVTEPVIDQRVVPLRELVGAGT